jgi:hypothetical protein
VSFLMPVPERFKYRNLQLPSKFTTTEEYKSAPGREPKFKEVSRNKQEHYYYLYQKFQALKDEQTLLDKKREAVGISGLEGITIVFKSEPDYQLKHESLDLRPSGIELLSVKTIQTDTYAAVFVPEGKIDIFLKKLDKYLKEAKNEKLFANIADIKKATVDALWTDDINLLPADNNPVWWEVWLRSGKNREDIVKFFRSNAEKIGLRVDRNELAFPDRTVLLVFGTRDQIAESIDLLNCIAELRKAKETPTYFLDMKRKFQQEWIDDLLRRLPKTISDEVAILLLDTGVNNEHPLIKPFLSSNDLHAYNIDWLKTDECGHGTGMAGLALYSDLMDLLVSNENVSIEHILESGKIIRQNGNEHQPELYGSVTSQVISLAEINAPERKRVISLTITAKDFRDRGKPSSWSSAIDKITSGAEEESGTKRLLIVSSGNIETQNRIYYPDRNIIEGIHDPGQSWNALCVGAYTQKVTIDTNNHPGLVPIAPAGDINPASTTSIKWDAQWPLKPDVVFEGGNWAKDANNSPIGGDPDEIRILTTNDKFTDNYFTITGDTSAATAQVARMAAIIQKNYPEFWTETIRALIVHSAEWTPVMLKKFNIRLSHKNKKADVKNLIRYCGFGVPDLNKAIYCAENRLNLIIQSSLYPYADYKKMKEMNLHEIPWPEDILRDLGETPVTLRVTLSYFIEPNPGERGWKRRHNYQSHGLRFDIQMPFETRDQFRSRINRRVREEEENMIETSSDSKEWLLGDHLRHRGSIHSDIWYGSAIDLASRKHVGVYPVIGWWREHTLHKRWNSEARYSLILSISTPKEDVNLYTEIANKIGIEVPV